MRLAYAAVLTLGFATAVTACNTRTPVGGVGRRRGSGRWPHRKRGGSGGEAALVETAAPAGRLVVTVA